MMNDELKLILNSTSKNQDENMKHQWTKKKLNLEKKIENL